MYESDDQPAVRVGPAPPAQIGEHTPAPSARDRGILLTSSQAAEVPPSGRPVHGFVNEWSY